MNLGPVNNSGILQLKLESNSAGEPKHISELYSEMYSEDERQTIADGYLQSVDRMETSRELLVEHATESVEKYKGKIAHYSSLLQAQSNNQPADTIRNKIQEYETYLEGYQRQLDYFKENPIEDDAVRNDLFKMAANMLGITSQEVMQNYEEEGVGRK